MLSKLFKLILPTLLFVFMSPAHAIPPLHLKNVEITGQVSLQGKPLAQVQVEVRKDSCFGEVTDKTLTNQQGKYRILKPDLIAGSILYLTVPAGGKAKQAYGAYCLFEGMSASSEKNVDTPTGDFYRTGQYLHTIKLAKPRAVTAEEKSCLKQGGAWGWLSQERLGCNRPYADAGKTCGDGSECSSQVCFSYWKDRMQLQMESLIPEKAKQGSCAVDKFQVLNHRPGPLVGELKQGKIVAFPVQ